MSKKIAILTQPLHDNYGGLLQAYALKETLELMGHDVLIVNRRKMELPKWRKIASFVYSKAKGRQINPNYFISKNLRDIISENTGAFQRKYIPKTSPLITDNEEMEKITSDGFDVYIVGSDQCWRPKYSPSIGNYFFDFAKNEVNVKRVSYAASFGVSNWEFNEANTLKCKNLIQKFDGVSVREDSALDLLKNHLNRSDGLHVVDPTMLLDRQHYIDIVNNEKLEKSKGSLKTYILDKTTDKMNIIRDIEKSLKIKHFDTLPPKRLTKDKAILTNINEFIYPGPLVWIRGYMDADFVITDSFHGCVFSIIFNVPFIAIGNKSRGLSRFQSLLKMFELESRLIVDTSLFKVDDFIDKKINWEKVNKILEKEKSKALAFLKTNID